MKLVQLLAKELKEWPKGATFIVQDENKNVWSLDKGLDLSYAVNEWVSEGWFNLVLVDGCDILIDSLAHDNKTSKVTQEQWKAEREKMNKPKWIRHRGGNSTLHPGTMVEARLRSGEIQRAIAGAFLWDNSLSDHAVNIMAYRIIEETKDQEIEEVKDTNISTLSITLDANDVFKPMIASMKEMALEWGQIESPLKWRDEIIELEAYEEEFRREREKLIRKLESEGFKLMDHMTPIYGEQIIDISDWRNWKVGDIVEVVANESSHNFDIGEEVVVSFIDNKDADLSVKAEYKDGRDFWWLAAKDGKFMRRP